MKKRIMWLVIIVLMLSMLPIFLLFNISGMIFIPPGLEGPCPCMAPDGTEVNFGECYAGDDVSFNQYYCESLCRDSGDDRCPVDVACSFAPRCDICGCQEGQECVDDLNSNIYFCGNVRQIARGGCIDGTSNGECSSTKPYYCENNVLRDNCELCGCNRGYVCERNRCLIQGVIEINRTINNTLIIWENVNQTNESTTELRVRDILLSGIRVEREIVDTSNLDDVTGVDYNTLILAEDRIRQNSEDLQALYLENGISDGLIKSILAQASQPLLSPGKDECVSYNGGSCLGLYECCESFVCNSGICASNLDVKTKTVEINLNEKIVGNDVSDLVEVSTNDDAVLDVVKYDTHPNYVVKSAVPNSVNFGFYEIKVDKEMDAKLSFEIDNGVILLNQIDSIGVYRLVNDEWQQLEFLDVKYGSERTTFTFKTTGFSYFEIIGTKDLPSTLTVSAGTPLWAVYKQSYTSDVSLVELSFQNKDKLTFGKISGVPFIDLGFELF
nr:hypothetical protein [Nanoarchaeum sp.]